MPSRKAAAEVSVNIDKMATPQFTIQSWLTRSIIKEALAVKNGKRWNKIELFQFKGVGGAMNVG